MREEVVSKDDEIIEELKGEMIFPIQFIKLVTKDRKEALDFLEKGEFQFLNKYSAKEVLNALINKGHLKQDDIEKKAIREELEKGGAYIEAASRLQFYPTDYQETMLSVSALNIRVKNNYRSSLNVKQKMLIEKIEKEYMEKKEELTDGQFYIEMVQRRRFDIVKQMFILNYGDRAGKILVADFFGGDGNWLSCFKSVDNKIEKYVKTLYNEIECNKYDEYKNSFNYSFNLAAEELLPKLKEKRVKIDIILFNPPYGQAIEERNAEFFFRLIKENEVLKSNGVMICALNEKDIRLLMPQLTKYSVRCAKRFSNEVEFKRLGQYYIELQGEAYSYAEQRNSKMIIESMLEIKEPNKIYKPLLTETDVDPFTDKTLILEEVELANDDFKYTPPNSTKNYIFDSLIKTEKTETLYMPKKPSYEEICTLISNGKLNNKMVDKEGNVLYVCGVNQKYVETVNMDEEDGDEDTSKRIEREVYSTSISIVDENRRYKFLSDYQN